jgi:hypothetical protein
VPPKEEALGGWLGCTLGPSPSTSPDQMRIRTRLRKPGRSGMDRNDRLATERVIGDRSMRRHQHRRGQVPKCWVRRRVSDRIASGRRRAARSARVPPYDWPTRCAPRPKRAAMSSDCSIQPERPVSGLRPWPHRSTNNNLHRELSRRCSCHCSSPKPKLPWTKTIG